jgi:hypothetical protein
MILKSAIHEYINRVYPGLEHLPGVEILDNREYKRKVKIDTPAAFDPMDNIIYFREIAIPTTICHEVHHWAQCQRLGRNRFIDTIKDLYHMLLLEREADSAAHDAVHRFGIWKHELKFTIQRVEI